jgi:hypothetical protein
MTTIMKLLCVQDLKSRLIFMSMIHNKSAIFIQTDEDKVANCIDRVWIAHITNILNERPGQHKNCRVGKEMSLL